jgi:hypothetical protein
MRACILLVFLLALTVTTAFAYPPTDDQIKQRLIRASVTEYLREDGNCPCPYSKDPWGHYCKDRSAYSSQPRSGILCYPFDVDKMMIYRYREALQRDQMNGPDLDCMKNLK